MSDVESTAIPVDGAAPRTAADPGAPRPRILIFTSYYLPGYRAGGPIRAIAGAIESLQQEYEVILLTRDRDVGSPRPYACVTEAARHGQRVTIHYLAPGLARIVRVGQLMRRYRPAVVYLNSAFDPIFTVIPLLWLKCRWLSPRPSVVLAPRGEFASDALALKGTKKRLYLQLTRRLRLYQGLVWQATASKEALEIQRLMQPKATDVAVVPDPPATVRGGRYAVCPERRFGPLRVVFLARITRMKNLEGALRILKRVTEAVEFSIVGPVEDRQYWSSCQDLIDVLPRNVTVEHRGPVTPDQVADMFLQQDLLLLPTLGESFGHVICEAWAGWCPVLISDRTPWRNLQHLGVGWDLPLDEPESFVEVIDRCARMQASDYQALKRRARSYAEELSATAQTRNGLLTLFTRVRHGGTPWYPSTADGPA